MQDRDRKPGAADEAVKAKEATSAASSQSHAQSADLLPRRIEQSPASLDDFADWPDGPCVGGFVPEYDAESRMDLDSPTLEEQREIAKSDASTLQADLVAKSYSSRRYERCPACGTFMKLTSEGSDEWTCMTC